MKPQIVTQVVNYKSRMVPFMPGRRTLAGPIGEETRCGLCADLLFLGVDGFDVYYGLSTPNLLEAKVNRAMVEVAKRTAAVFL